MPHSTLGAVPGHPFRFSVQCPLAADARSWADLARQAEDLGYSTLTISDHLDDQFAPGPALVAAAAATTTLRVGTLVYCNDYHHPVVLAREAATIDLLSDGRFELGMGAGWMTSDYERAGIALDAARTRIDRLDEAVTIVKGLFGDEPVDLDGDHYQVTGLLGAPRPVQRPHPPLLIGGGGRHMLSLAARHADIVGLNIDMRAGIIGEPSGPTATAEATHRKLGWIREAAGDRFDDLELQVRIHLAQITDDRPGLSALTSPFFGLTVEEGLVTPHALAGSVAEIVEQCQARREEFGISYIGFSLDVMEAMAPVVAQLAGR
jgi:probable F420-dependent oxidoreductase